MRLVALVLVAPFVLSGCVDPATPTRVPVGVGAPALPPLVFVTDSSGAPSSATADPRSVPRFVIRDLHATASEPTIGVTSQGNIFVDAVVPLTNPLVTQVQPIVLRSTDRGKSWTQTGSFPDGAPVTQDAYLYVDPATNRVFADHLATTACSWLTWSDDEGASWSSNPAACGLPNNDHQTIVAGKPRAGTTTIGYPNVVYYAYNGNYPSDAKSVSGSSNVARSIDGGVTFAPAALAIDGAHCGGLNGHLRVDAEGRVFLPGIGCDEPVLAISEDSGQSFTDVTIESGRGRSRPGDDPSLGVDTAGNLYYAWPGKDARMYLVTSRDHGHTWSHASALSPQVVTSALEVTGVAGDPGRIAFAYYGSKSPTKDWQSVNSDDATPDATWYVFVTYSLNALDAHPVFTTVQLPADDKPIQRGRIHNGAGGDPARNLLDFFDLVIDDAGRVYVAYTDGCHGCTSADTSRASALTVALLDTGPSLLSRGDTLNSLGASAMTEGPASASARTTPRAPMQPPPASASSSAEP
ncbi:MAG: sialidase family protein [Thermoplasmatota archaeon]